MQMSVGEVLIGHRVYHWVSTMDDQFNIRPVDTFPDAKYHYLLADQYKMILLCDMGTSMCEWWTLLT